MIHRANVLLTVVALASVMAHAQVYSPRLTNPGQLDTTDLHALAADIYRDTHAVTDRQKAEAIWRFYLTDGRFVKPGMFYHIPGWSYEEPLGEVLDPIKLINTYGFGLCYQDAPLLQATWEAGGFPNARVWFLTGHTVAEVFYDGQYHYYDADMMGFTTVGNGPVNSSTVASVMQLASNKEILLSKLEDPTHTRPGAVPNPWYNADVRAGAIGDLSDLFTSTNNNYVYAYHRFPHGHTMDFTLRPGESMTRLYEQPDSNTRYTPFSTNGSAWQIFPKDWSSRLQVKNGPLSEKDARRWSTGYLAYAPPQSALEAATKENATTLAVSSPYVIFGAKFSLQLNLKTSKQSLLVQTSIDDGHTWTDGQTQTGPFHGAWEAAPAETAHTANGSMSAVSGTYQYKVRFIAQAVDAGYAISCVKLATFFEFNPRTLPQLKPGTNEFHYQDGDFARHELPIRAANAKEFASSVVNVETVNQSAQYYLRNQSDRAAEMIFKLQPQAGTTLAGFDAGGRFLDLSNGLAPDKLTAEVRRVAPWPGDASTPQSADISWSENPAGPWKTLWAYDRTVAWPDHVETPQIIRWPEVDKQTRDLPAGTGAVYVRYRFQNIAVDSIRLATVEHPNGKESNLQITQTWLQNGAPRSSTHMVDGGQRKNYRIRLPDGDTVTPQALTFSAP